MCNSCEALVINGLKCHEHGCPNSGNKSSRCISCDEKYFVRDMITNEYGAGYVCKDCIDSWNNDGQEVY